VSLLPHFASPKAFALRVRQEFSDSFNAKFAEFFFPEDG
jgi:hypothetical protein